MDQEKFYQILNYLVDQTIKMKDENTDQKAAPIDYICIFSQSEDEYHQLDTLVKQLGDPVDPTPTGMVYKLTQPFKTPAGLVYLLKIRIYDGTKPQRGDCDFRVDNYPRFKQKYLDKLGFNLIERAGFEMIELKDPNFDVLAYFPNIPLTKDLGIKV